MKSKSSPAGQRAGWLKNLERGLSRLPVLRRVETLAVGDIWGAKFHTTASHELIHVLNGEASIQFQRRSFRVAPGDTFIIPQGRPHRDVRAEGPDYRVIYVFFEWPAAETVIRCLDPCVLLEAPAGIKAHFHLMLKELEAEYLSEDHDAPARLRLVLVEVLLALFRYVHHAAPREHGVQQRVARARRKKMAAEVRAYLQQHYGREISVDALAENFGVSPFHLSRSFSQEFGLSIIETLTLLRMEKAKELLSSKLSVKEVAARVGYSDGNYFAKVFRHVNGLSPSQYLLQR